MNKFDLNKEMADFFNTLAADWTNNPDEYEIRENITAMMGLTSNAVIADIGCGKGVMFPHLLKRNPKQILGIDISGEMIDGARRAFFDNRITYIHDDLFRVQLPALDAAIIFNAYPHFMDKDALVKKLAIHIKKDGFVVIAHSRSKETINGIHNEERTFTLSVPLEKAEIEAGKFTEFFHIEKIIDNNESYFIKLIRK